MKRAERPLYPLRRTGGVAVFDLRDDDFEYISDLLRRTMRRASAAMIDLDVRAINFCGSRR